MNKQPRWVRPFLMALGRTGSVRLAARDSGIDHSTAYARRRTHAEFAAGWVEALRVNSEARRAAEAEVAPAVPSFRSAEWSPAPSPCDHGERVICNGRMIRANSARWSKAAEQRFFAALADMGNVKAAADAAGFSTTAVYARRLRHPGFREQWAAAVDSARARLELHVIEAANVAFERAAALVPGAPPDISIHDALQILRAGAEPRPPGEGSSRRAGERGSANDRMASDAEVRLALAKRLHAFGVRVANEDVIGKPDDSAG